MAAFLAIEPGWLTHPKIQDLSNDARVLWIAGAIHAVALETDGRVARRMIPLLVQQIGVSAKRGTALVAELVAVGLWTDRGDYYLIHDFLKYNQSKAMREAQREKWRKAKAKAAGLPADSKVESQEDSEEGSTRIPRASLPCLALPTEKALGVPPRNPPRNGDSTDPPNPPTDEGRAVVAEIRRRQGWTRPEQAK